MRIHHVAFRTDDLERLERFYVDVLGLASVRRAARRSVWLDAAGSLLMLEQRAPDEPGLAPGSMEMVAFAIAPAQREELEGRLRRSGVAIEARTAFTLYVRDPDGRRIGLSSYPEELG